MKKNIIIKIMLVMISFLFITNVKAEDKNEVTLNFEGGIIHDGYVEYSNIGKLQLFKGDVLVTNISNSMKIDLNEFDYKFIIEETSDNVGGVIGTISVKLNINNWYYPMTKIVGDTKLAFNLESNKFNGVLDVKLKRIGTVVNTRVENVYTDMSLKGIIDLTDIQEYIIDFSKDDDELMNGLKLFADLEKTLYYKNVNGSLLKTDNENEAVIKIVGNKDENKAYLTVLNTGNNESDSFKGLYTKYTGSKLQYDGIIDGIINETRTDYYIKCNYDFTFKYANKKSETTKEIIYKFLEGENQKYIINENTNAKFRIDADYSLFQNGGKVYVDDILIDTNNYTSESGSTIIILKKEYLSKLNAGEHKLKVVFNDGGVAESKFTISETEKEAKEIIKNPQTSDSITTYITLFIISILAIVTTVIINNIKKEEC